VREGLKDGKNGKRVRKRRKIRSRGKIQELNTMRNM